MAFLYSQHDIHSNDIRNDTRNETIMFLLGLQLVHGDSNENKTNSITKQTKIKFTINCSSK